MYRIATHRVLNNHAGKPVAHLASLRGQVGGVAGGAATGWAGAEAKAGIWEW